MLGPLGGPEMILIFIVVLLLFGAKKLPELARGMGKSLGEFKKAKDEFEHEIMTADQDAYHGRTDDKPSSSESKKDKDESVSAAPDTEPHGDDDADDTKKD